MKIPGLTFFFFALCCLARAQGLILPQTADGGGWQTTIVLTNSNASPATASLTFYMDAGSGATQAWNLAFVEGGSTQGMQIPAGATMLLHTPGAASTEITGWGELDADPGVSGYALLTQSVPGQPNQVVAAAGAAAGNRLLMPFDNTNGASTGVTLVNTSTASQTIAVAFSTPGGGVTQDSVANVPPQGHMIFPLAQQFPEVSGQAGLAEFYNSSGTFSLLAQRTDATGAAVASPVYSQTGSPILVGGGSPGGGAALPPFSSIVVTGTFSPNGQPSYQINVTISNLGFGANPIMTTVVSTGVYVQPTYTAAAFSAAFPSVSQNGLTFTFSGFQAGNGGAMEDKNFQMYGITSASLSLTLAPGAVVTTGNATGNLSLTSSLVSLSGSFTATYILHQ